jgi:hypothetical protein
MAKRSRTYAPPPGALAPLRNTRLYGGRDEQVEGNALRSRGCPNPDRAAVYTARPKRPVKTASPAGGMPVGRPIELAQASDANKVKAAA